MEMMGSSVRERRSRETSPDRARVYMPPKMKPFRKVQVIYYLCRNGQLEHPHFMELSHLPNQQLRLKDVLDRLSVLRGRAMTSLYSWSCKRTYKNGYVWNDLGENDVIHPADGVEYILKGSEVLESCTEGLQQLQLVTHRRRAPPMLTQNRHLRPEEEQEETGDMEIVEEEEEEEEEEEQEEVEEIEEDKGHHQHQHHKGKRSNNSNSSKCSRGVSTDELDLTDHHQQQQPAELHLDENGASPPSSSSSEKAANTVTDKPSNNLSSSTASSNHGGSNRFDDVDSEPSQTRTPSVLLQLIACGSVAVKGRTGFLKKPSSSSTQTNSVGNGVGNSGRKSLHRGVLCRLAASQAAEDDVYNEINYMSENPRFGNPQMEEKEYFSGSIVESIATETRAAASGGGAEPTLKKSSSYNEERSSKCGIGEGIDKIGEERGVKGKCIPGRRRSASKLQQQQQLKK